jgi:hypothetical protein
MNRRPDLCLLSEAGTVTPEVPFRGPRVARGAGFGADALSIAFWPRALSAANGFPSRTVALVSSGLSPKVRHPTPGRCPTAGSTRSPTLQMRKIVHRARARKGHADIPSWPIHRTDCLHCKLDVRSLLRYLIATHCTGRFCSSLRLAVPPWDGALDCSLDELVGDAEGLHCGAVEERPEE